MIENYIPKGYSNRVSREYLVSASGCSDRQVREHIEEAVRDRHIVIISCDGGYFMPDGSKEDDMRMLDYLRKESARAKSIFKKIATIREAVNLDKNQIKMEDVWS